MKKWILIAFALLFCLSFSVPSLAANKMPRVVDNADLLTESEERALLSTLDKISDKQQADVVIVTVTGIGSKSPMAYADDFYDENGYGYGSDADGILLLISMEDRDYWMSTSGFGITAFTDEGIEYISEQFLSDLSAGDYADAFTTYAELCDDFLTQAKEGAPYDRGNMPKEPFPVIKSLLIALIIGFVIALLITNSLKNQLKTVRAKDTANGYVKNNSMHVIEHRDLFLYSRVNRVPRPKNTGSSGSRGSSTHRSSSGRSHGGGGGQF